MNMFKSVTLFLGTLGVVGATALSVETPKVSADSTTTLQVNAFTTCTGNVYGSTSVSESKYGVLFLGKMAVKGIIRNRATAVRVVSQYASAKDAAMFNVYYYDVTNALKPLLSRSEVPTQAVFDAVYRGLVGSLGNQRATRIANALAGAVSLLI
ncbi:hypothetical protein FGL74_05085 [Leuconostoc koreense]|nr:hypothetical protein FGL74_05085 [Leuconostoc mesenteroides]QGM25006.1 hypothetical protein GJV51_03060 [Leuconostoc mesenteroides subsp. mesenteroides]